MPKATLPAPGLTVFTLEGYPNKSWQAYERQLTRQVPVEQPAARRAKRSELLQTIIGIGVLLLIGAAFALMFLATLKARGWW